MATELQNIANQMNALKSTGQKDASKTRFNALKHGLTAKILVVKDYEDVQEFESMMEHLLKDEKPEGCIERLLIYRIASSYWRLQRIQRLEKKRIEYQLSAKGDANREIQLTDSLMIRYESTLERQFYKALNIYLKIQWQ